MFCTVQTSNSNITSVRTKVERVRKTGKNRLSFSLDFLPVSSPSKLKHHKLNERLEAKRRRSAPILVSVGWLSVVLRSEERCV